MRAAGFETQVRGFVRFLQKQSPFLCPERLDQPEAGVIEVGADGGATGDGRGHTRQVEGRQLADARNRSNDTGSHRHGDGGGTNADTHEHGHEDCHHEHGHDHGGSHHEHGHAHGHHHADEVFTSWGRETIHTFTVPQIEEILARLEDEEQYGDVLRAKGMVAGADGRWIYFDMVPGEHEVREGAPEYTGRICVIGAKLDEKKLEELFGLA